jgi:hypothetical protein
MSGRFATLARSHRTRIALVCAVAFACGLVGTTLGAQDPKGEPKEEPKQKSKDRAEAAGKLDGASPLPADAPRKKPPAQFALNTDRLMFAKIEDFKPVAAPRDNNDEYSAWVEVVMHAKQFATADLEAAATRDLTPVDLIKPVRSAFRCELLRFDGRLVCARRLPVPKFFTENPDSGVKEMYEVRLVPLNESPLTPVSVALLELPEALAKVRAAKPEEWVEADGWFTAAGYFFKTMSVPGNEGSLVNVPVLIGKSVTPLPGPPVPPGTDPTALDPNVRVYKFIRDETFMIDKLPSDTLWAELASYNRLLIHAHRFSAEQLEQHARADTTFADLFEPVRRDFRLQNVKFEGRLISLRRINPSKDLKLAGIEHVFEGWLVWKDEPRGNPMCVHFTEPLEGVEATGRVNKWVTFAGFSFKKMRYTSGEPDPKNKDKTLDKYAPMLVGKRPILRTDPTTVPDTLSWDSFVWWVVGGIVALIGGAGLLTWWYRGGDRVARKQIDNVRGKNPFADGPPPPPVAPANDWTN